MSRLQRATLTAAMGNQVAWRLGKLTEVATSPEQKVGDYVDRGLILLRLLNEAGYDVVLSSPESNGCFAHLNAPYGGCADCADLRKAANASC